ncbi:Hypothetical protein NocV09_00400570 [Nannochloropsis oceanica]
MSGADCRGQVFNEAAASVKHDRVDDDDENTHDAPPPPPTPLHTDMRAQRCKGNILESLSEISLENEDAEEGGAWPQRPGGSMPSAARTMIELKAIEKVRNQINALNAVPSRGGASPAASYRSGGGAAASGGKLSFALPSALDQATASFGGETETLASFDRMHSGGGKGRGQGGIGSGGKGSGRKAVLSTKARQRKVVGTEREEAYNDRLTGRVVKHNKRKERMERLRRIY